MRRCEYIERKTQSKNILEFLNHFSSRSHKLFFGPPCRRTYVLNKHIFKEQKELLEKQKQELIKQQQLLDLQLKINFPSKVSNTSLAASGGKFFNGTTSLAATSGKLPGGGGTSFTSTSTNGSSSTTASTIGLSKRQAKKAAKAALTTSSSGIFFYLKYFLNRWESSGQTSSMICQRLDTRNGLKVQYTFILSDNQLFELYHLCLEVHCTMYELRHFMAKAFPLLKLIMTSTGWGAVSTIFKVFGMTWSLTQNLWWVTFWRKNY